MKAGLQQIYFQVQTVLQALRLLPKVGPGPSTTMITMMASGTSIVIVGDAKQFLEPLRERFGEVQVIPLEELDLEAPGLRKVKEAA